MANIHIEQIRDDLTWRIRREAMYPDEPLDSVKLEEDKEGVHFGLFADDQLTTVISLFHEGTVHQFRKFATIVRAQGKGYGSTLLEHTISYAKEQGATRIWCNARVSAIAFYAKFGFSETGQSFRKRNIDFVIMELQLDNPLDA
jgi:predicted GNAT family N-acyltransferase